MSVNRPLDPVVGSQLSVLSFRQRVANPLYANDVALEARIAALESTVAGLPHPTRSPIMPPSAIEDDVWFDTTDPDYPIMYVCDVAYLSSAGVIGTNWLQIQDPRAYAKAQDASDTASTATQTTVSDTMPDAAVEGWIWVDTSVAGQNQTYACRETYTSGQGIPPGTVSSQWVATLDVTAELFAATAQGLLDGYTNTLVDATVPDAANARDMWIDEDADNSTYYARLSYASTDGRDWTAGPFVAGEYAHEDTTYYRAIQDNAGTRPSTTPADWTVVTPVSVFADLTAFRESFWNPTVGVVAYEAALAAQTAASGKSTNYYLPTIPDSANTNDTWINTATSQGYVCSVGYASGAGIDPGTHPTESQWKVVLDAQGQNILQSRIDDMQTVLDGKSANFFQNLVPAAADTSDFWVDTNDDYTILVNTFAYPYVATDGQTDPTGPYTAGQIVYHAGSYYRASADTASLPPGGVWVVAFAPPFSVAVWSGASNYDVGDNVTYAGQVWRARAPSFSTAPVTPGTDSGVYWATVAATADSVAIFRAMCWILTTDAYAQRIADGARALADGKVRSTVSPTHPDSADIGDLWTNTSEEVDPINLPGVYRQYRCSVAYASGGFVSLATNFIVDQDAVAQKIANDAFAAVDHKRTTFVTNFDEPTASWPSGAEVMGPAAIPYWSQLPKGPGDTIAQVGDLWVNFVGPVQYVRICKTAYRGDVSDPGSVSAWNTYSLDGLLTAELAGYYKLDGTQHLTAPINFNLSAVSGTQDFIGRTLSVTGDATARDVMCRTLSATSDVHVANDIRVADEAFLLYGGTSAAPGVPTQRGHGLTLGYALDAFSTTNGHIDTLSASTGASLSTISGDLSSHTGNTSNPHGVTLAQAASATGTGGWTYGGVITATGFTVSSKRELKSLIFPLSGAYADEVVAGLTPVEFEYKDAPGKRRFGFIFEDSPNEVRGESGMDLAHIVAFLVDIVKRKLL